MMPMVGRREAGGGGEEPGPSAARGGRRDGQRVLSTRTAAGEQMLRLRGGA
jgi:hypothetical protein